MIELLFVDAQFQCGASAPLAEFEVISVAYEEQGAPEPFWEETLTAGDSVLLPVNTREQVGIQINILNNADCIDVLEDMHLIEIFSVDQLPDVDALYDQPALESYIEALSDSQSIILGEFGCGGNIDNCTSADWQDILIRIDYNPTVYAD